MEKNRRQTIIDKIESRCVIEDTGFLLMVNLLLVISGLDPHQVMDVVVVMVVCLLMDAL